MEIEFNGVLPGNRIPPQDNTFVLSSLLYIDNLFERIKLSDGAINDDSADDIEDDESHLPQTLYFDCSSRYNI